MPHSRAVQSVAAAWILSLAMDLFSHGGVLARLYMKPSPFLLPLGEAFRRIPLGYAAFLGLTIALYWLLTRLGVQGWRAGLRYGVIVGAVVWGAMLIGLYSMTTAPPSLLMGWWVGQTAELGLAGAVLGAAAAGSPLKRIWSVVAVAAALLVVAAIVLQSAGLAPAMKVG